nr:PREDICTED: solute carrier organic anion transporter family member 4C1 isoform X2 [Latimeria chalumnae]|eukprot:XP_014342404.1 PREDICTED: solute carrier organic anion transporter family member 4C1 isoform X2 [Latimeria chalumnae]
MDNPAYIADEYVQVRETASKREQFETNCQGSTQKQETEEGPCGWSWFTPNCIQCCNNPKGYLFFYSVLAIVQGTVVNGLINISISTIEKRYELSSSLAGVISASYDISFCLLSVFVSYYGERGHKPRWLAFSAFMIGLGSLVFAVPHFTSGQYEYGAEIRGICVVPGMNSSNPICRSSVSMGLSNYLYVFILAQLLLGVGGTPIYTLGTAFIDDSVPTDKSSLYIGIGFGMSVLGPAVGYLLGGQLLNIYIDVNKGYSTDLTAEDPRWLGAWWIAFLMFWLIAWCLIAPLSCFPKHLPGTAEIQAAKISQTHCGGKKDVEQNNSWKSLKDFPKAFMFLLKNTVFLCLTMSSASEALVIAGFVTFLPKFIENQYGQTSSFAAILGGSVLIPGASIGQIIGGTIVSKCKLKCRNMIKLAIITTAVSLLFCSVFVISKCGNDPFAGVSETYHGTGEIGTLRAPCNSNCSCFSSHYEPVCGADGVQYFSPCFAGCTAQNVQDSKTVYHDCSCINNGTEFSNGSLVELEAHSGKCTTTCKNLALFLGLFTFAVVFTFMTSTPVTTAILRCVPDKQRSFALGVQWLFVRFLGTIPGPILFGVAIDSSCTLWSVKECGNKGACWTYNNIKMAYVLAAMRLLLLLQAEAKSKR